jgi:hypothetical protein
MTKQEQTALRQEMFSLMKKYEESNLSAREFYPQHNMSDHKFYYWLRRYKEVQHSPDHGFIPVEVNSSVPAAADVSGDIHIQYPNGVVVTLNKSVSISRLRALIKTV